MHKPSKIYRAVRPLLFGCFTGIVCGAVIALFIACARLVSSFALGMYNSADAPLFIVCIIALVFISCIVMAVVQTLCPQSKGSGIPLAEGCARGMLKVKWLRSAAALIAGSLISFLCGLPLGSEGPSIGVGGLLGEGIGRMTKNNAELRRYLITGGSSAGLAVAFNAPLTGVTLALEETHRRFSPGILLAAFSAVIPAVAISQLIFWGLSHNAFMYSIGIRLGAALLPELTVKAYDGAGILFTVCGIAVIAGILSAGLAVLFNRTVFALGKLFAKIHSPILRLLPAFILTVICAIALPVSAGSGEAALGIITVSSATWLLLTLIVLRFVLSATASASGATGGLFLPMIAISGLLGMLTAKICVLCGLNDSFANNIVIICIAAFFAASVRAPISAIVMALELTASFANLLPVTVAVAFATAIGGLTKTAPLYERMMEDLQKSAKPDIGARDITLQCIVQPHSVLLGKRIRDILWPYNSLVTELIRADGTPIVPDGETVVLEGDKLTVNAQNVVELEFENQIAEYSVITVPTEKSLQ